MVDVKFTPAKPRIKRSNYNPLEVIRHTLRYLFNHDSLLFHHATKNPGDWECMEIIYNNKPQARNKFFPGFIDLVCLNSRASRATRSRKNIAYHEISRLIRQHGIKNENFNIISLGSGPAHDIIAALYNMREIQPAFATCVDIDARAIEYGRQIAQAHQLSGNIEFVHRDANDIATLPRRYDMASIIGLLEYLSAEECTKFLSNTKNILKADSRILISNMKEHSLSGLMSFLGVWPLKYRRLEVMEEITRTSGFDIEKSYYGPHGLHSFIIARNRALK